MAFNLSRILCSRSLALQKFNGGLCSSRTMLFTTSANRSVQLKIVPPSTIDKLSYEEKNSLLKRELSPHLTIYKVQLTSVLSISHRITGMTLSALATGLAVAAILPPNDFSYYVTAVESLKLSAGTLAFIKFYVALPATYHTLNGVRHLLWDNGKFFKLDEVYKTGYIVVALSIVSALALAAL